MKCTKTMTERLLALTLSVATAFSAVPTQALAEVADSLESTPVEAAAEVDETAEDEQLPATDEGEKASEAETPAETTEGGSAAEAEGKAEGETASDEAASEAEDETEGQKASTEASTSSDEPVASESEESIALASAGDDADVKAVANTNDSKVSVSFQLIGVTADGTDEAWITKTYQVEKDSSAADLIETALKDANLTHTSTYDGPYGYYLSDITSTDGRKLEYDAVTGKYWQLFVDGAASGLGASSVSLSAGTSILLYYSAYGVNTQSVSLSIIGPDDAGGDSCWVANASYEFVNDATAADAIEQTLTGAGLEHVSSTTQYGYYLESITRNGKTYAYDVETGDYWQLFVNGKASEVGASSVVLSDGDRIQLVYSAYGDTAEATASVQVIGLDSADMPESWATSEYSFERGEATAADASEALFAACEDITASTSQTSWGWSLDSITYGGKTYAYDSATGEYWQLFINGTAASVMADGYTLQPGDKIVWAYSCYGDDVPEPGAESAEASVELIGLDSNGNAARWGTLSGWEFEAGTTVAQLSEALFKDAGITADYGETTWGWSLNSVTSPYDSSIVLSSEQDGDGNWHYWHLYVNGEMATSMASGITLKNGDKVQWYYGTDSDDPSSSTIVDPGAEGADWDSDWSGYTSADKVTDAPTPTEDAEAKWVIELKKSSDWNTYYSDPILVGDYLYVVVGNTLYKKNVDTGETVEGGTATLVDKVDSVSRIVYTDGLILIPLSTGRLQAVTVDTMVTKWVTSALPNSSKGGKLQSLSAVTVKDGYAYFGASAAGWSDCYGGNLLCVRISDGKVMWNKENENSTGYYWAGMAFSGNYGVIGDDAGNVCTIDPATGNTVSTLKVSSKVRSTVLTDGSFAYVVSYDGYLYKLSVASDGTLSEVAKVQFAYSSTSTPVLANGKIYVGGTSLVSYMGGRSGNYEQHAGQLAVIDAATMKVETSIYKADGDYICQMTSGKYYGGDVKSQPVVSIQGDKTYVYFTSNNNPGCIYRYCVGDDEAEVLYMPDSSGQQYCMSSISVGSDGSLYYANDSGKLFAVKGNGQRLPRYNVSFDLNGATGTAPATQRVKSGKVASAPSDPVRAGYTFLGWYTDAAGTTAWDFSSPVTSDMTLYAKWQSNTPASDDDGQDDNSGSGQNNNGGSGSQISINGNAKASSFTTIALTSNVAVAQDETDEASAESLLSGFSSGKATGTSKTTTTTSGTASEGARENSGEATASTGMPIWPFIGLGIGAAALIIVLVAKRNKEDEE